MCNYKSGYTDGLRAALQSSLSPRGLSHLAVTAEIFDDLSTLADATRSRMLVLLERHELTVSELCTVLQLPQSTMSRHLKTLSDAGWGTSRRDGTGRRRRGGEPLLHALARRPRPRASLVVAAPRTGQRHGGRRSGCAPVEKRPG